MSYPGYPPYQQQPGYNQPSYGMPQSQNALPYPTTGSIFPNNIGFSMNAPGGGMPQPGFTAPSGYPPSGYGGYNPQPPPRHYAPPPPAANYPPQGGYGPPPTGAYPVQGYGGAYPTQPSAYPGGYSQAQGNYPTHSGGYGAPPPGNYQHPPAAYAGGYNSAPGQQQPVLSAPVQEQIQPSGPASAPPNHAPPPIPASSVETFSSVQTIQYTPTVRPIAPFNASSDVSLLRKAMKGLGTDEQAIINVLARRSNAQRLQIASTFKTMYGKDLLKELKSELGGSFEDLILALMTPLHVFHAQQLRNAVSGFGTNEEVLIETLCTMNNEEIRLINDTYQSIFNRRLEQDLMGDTSGTFKRLMVSLCNAGRDESTRIDRAAATADAEELHRAGVLKLGTDESTFNMILCQRSFGQLALVFDEYKRLTGKDIENAIKSEFSGNAQDGLLTIVRTVRDRPGYFAKKLNASMSGLGTNDKQLIRLIVTRCEIDLENIKQSYRSKYGKTLKDAILSDTSGDYKKCLVALLAE